MPEFTEEEIARAPNDIPSDLATRIMALDWKARKDWTVEEQADRYGEIQDMIDALLQPALERARREERERAAKVADEHERRDMMFATGYERAGNSAEMEQRVCAAVCAQSIAAAIRKG